MAAVSARRMRGPRETAVVKGRDRSRSPSSGEKPPSGPINIAHGPSPAPRRAVTAGAPPVSSQNISRRPGLGPASQLSSRASSLTGSSMTGTSSRPVCSAASSAMASSRSRRMRSALVRWVTTSRTRRAPSSAAFSTMVSTRGFFTTATISSRSGPRVWGRTCSSARRITPFFSTSATVHRHSPSRPLKTSKSSPVFSRITWVR